MSINLRLVTFLHYNCLYSYLGGSMRFYKAQYYLDALLGKQEFFDKERSKIIQKDYYCDKYIYKNEDSQNIIYEKLLGDKPCLICKYGSVELDTIRQFLTRKGKYQYTKAQKYAMGNNTGFYPVTDSTLHRFSCEMIEIARNIDILSCCLRPFEEELCKKYFSIDVKLVSPGAVCPSFNKNPWSKALKGKKVLVIHPFEKTIRKQYEKHSLLFSNQDVLPDFELITLQAVQSIADNKSTLPYKDWFEALEYMKSQIANIDFDIALIGAGAYGMFLGDYCKRIGKKAVHMGSYVQLLFGIKGARWDKYFCDSLYNEHWVRPDESERPKGAEKVEGACYW